MSSIEAARAGAPPTRLAATPTLRGHAGSVWRFLRPFGPHLAIVLAFSWAIVFVAWLLLPSARIVEVAIPLGTAARVAQDEIVEALPRDLSLRRGDTLVLTNDDEMAHAIGAIHAEPGRSTRAIVDRELERSGSLPATFQPSGRIEIVPQSPPSIAQTAKPTAMLWLPLSAAMVLTLSITRRLEPS